MASTEASRRTVESSAYGRLALLSAVLCWMLALARLGLALERHEAGVDFVLSLGVVLVVPGVVLLHRVNGARPVRPANEATIIPFPSRRTTTGRRAS